MQATQDHVIGMNHFGFKSGDGSGSVQCYRLADTEDPQSIGDWYE